MISKPAPQRLFERAVALCLLLLGAPLLGSIAILIWHNDGRPVFFTQTRAGQNGVPFSILKFRTLDATVDSTCSPSEHVTSTGSVLRRWALDELPQLWNVVRGEMNLVGPRPVLPSETDGYDERAARRLDVRPGLTGWAQVHGRNSLDWSRRMELDLWYVQNRSVLLDLWIVAKTPLTLLSGEGVYGPGTNDPSSSAVQTHLSSKDA